MSPWLALVLSDCTVVQLWLYAFGDVLPPWKTLISPLIGSHRITEWGKLEGTTVAYLVPPPCSSRVITEHMVQDCVQKVLESLSLCSAFPFLAVKGPEGIMAGMSTG